jgi:hypothetical protein
MRMLRRLIAGASAGLLLAGGLVSSPAEADYKPWGSTSAKDQVLKPGCAYYHYRFRVDPPTDNWAAEVFLLAPNGGPVSSGALLAASDPSPGKARFRLCRPSLVTGKYKIRMKVSYKDGYDLFEGYVKPSYFRLLPRR